MIKLVHETSANNKHLSYGTYYNAQKGKGSNFEKKDVDVRVRITTAILFTYFLAAVGLRCYTRAFFSCTEIHPWSGDSKPPAKTYRKAQAILLRVGSHSLILASCEASNIWPRRRDSDDEPGLCSCCDKGKPEGAVGNHAAAAGHSQHGAIFPVACSSSSQTKSTHTRPE
ncbi:hypothetical protein MJT46_013830, partial [Ovis ammon polii x Ovis aries]